MIQFPLSRTSQGKMIKHFSDRRKYICLCPVVPLWPPIFQATLVSLMSPEICKAFTRFRG